MLKFEECIEVMSLKSCLLKYLKNTLPLVTLITLYKTFLKRHSGQGDISYDEICKTLFQKKIQAIHI